MESRILFRTCGLDSRSSRSWAENPVKTQLCCIVHNLCVIDTNFGYIVHINSYSTLKARVGQRALKKPSTLTTFLSTFPTFSITFTTVRIHLASFTLRYLLRRGGYLRITKMTNKMTKMRNQHDNNQQDNNQQDDKKDDNQQQYDNQQQHDNQLLLDKQQLDKQQNNNSKASDKFNTSKQPQNGKVSKQSELKRAGKKQAKCQANSNQHNNQHNQHNLPGFSPQPNPSHPSSPSHSQPIFPSYLFQSLYFFPSS